MKSTELQKPCTVCHTPTRFVRHITGPRGAHIRWEPCCVPCGEQGLVAAQPPVTRGEAA